MPRPVSDRVRWIIRLHVDLAARVEEEAALRNIPPTTCLAQLVEEASDELWDDELDLLGEEARRLEGDAVPSRNGHRKTASGQYSLRLSPRTVRRLGPLAEQVGKPRLVAALLIRCFEE